MIRETRNLWRQTAVVALGLVLSQVGDAQAQFGGIKAPKISNPVQQIQKQSSSAGQQISNAAKSAGNSVSNAGKSAASQAQKLGQTAKSTANSASNTVKKTQSQANNTIGQSTQHVQKQASNMGSSFNNSVKSAQPQNHFGDFMKAINNANSQIKPQGNPFQPMQNQTNNGFRNAQNQFQNGMQSVRNQTNSGMQHLQRQTGNAQQHFVRTTQQFPQQITTLPSQLPPRLPQVPAVAKLPSGLPTKLPGGLPKLPTQLPGKLPSTLPTNLSKIPSVPKIPSVASVGVPKLSTIVSVNALKVDTQIAKNVISQPGKDLATLTQKSGDALVTATTKPLEPLIGILAGGQGGQEEMVAEEEVIVLGEESPDNSELTTEETTAGPDPLPEPELVDAGEPLVDPNAAALDLATAIVGLVQTAVANGNQGVIVEENAVVDQGTEVIAAEPVADSVPVEAEAPAEYTVLVKNLTEESVSYSVRRAGSAWGTYTLPAGEEHKFVIPAEELEVQYSVDGQETPITVPAEHIYAFALDNGQLGLFLADPEE